MRMKARELLAWFCCHPDGGTADTVVEALWPEVDPRRVSQRFWNSVTSLRGRLREATGVAELRLLEQSGTRYRLVDGELEADLWELERAVAAASTESEEAARACALERAVSLYSGDLLADCDWLWAETLQGDLRSRILDALVSLAETRERSGDAEASLAALNRAITIDPYGEELYGRKMRLHGLLGRPDAVRRTFGELSARLDEIGLDPSEATRQLLTEMSSPPRRRAAS